VLLLRAEFDGIVPPVWRRLLVSDRATLLELHAVVAAAFGLPASAMHQFTLDGVTWHDADAFDDGRESTAMATLDQLDLRAGARIAHVADHGTSAWRHVVTVEERRPRLVGQRLPACVAAGGASPPEGIDTPERYRAMRAALSAEDGTGDEELREWLPTGFDADFADLAAINAALGEVPRL
jgi:hypothetical protein